MTAPSERPSLPLNASAGKIFKLEKNTLTIAAGEPGVDVTPTEFQRSATNRIRSFVFTKP